MKALERAACFERRITKTLLNIEIIDIHDRIRQLGKSIMAIEYEIMEKLPETIYQKYFLLQNKKLCQQFNSIKEGQSRKFRKLLELQKRLKSMLTDDKWFVNLSNVKFPTEVRETLAIGPNFVLPTTKKNFPDSGYLLLYRTRSQIVR